jgi:hypothetical protein
MASNLTATGTHVVVNSGQGSTLVLNEVKDLNLLEKSFEGQDAKRAP